MATEVFYVRHGEIAAKVAGDPGLSPAGRAMARRVGQSLVPHGPVSIWSSPLARAHQTASTIGAALELEPLVDQRLRERLNWGDAPGQPFDEFVEVWDRCTADRHHVASIPGGRSACQAGCGVVELVDALSGVRGEGPVVLVAHGGLLVDLLSCLAETGRSARVETAPDVPYCSITHLRWGEQVEVVTLAATGHLDEVRTTRAD